MRFWSRLPPWVFVSAAWLVVGVLAASNEIVARRLNGNSWAPHDIVFAGAGAWLALAALTPFVFHASRRWPVAAPRIARRVALHVAFALVFWVVASTLYQGVMAWLFNPHAVQGATSGSHLFSMLLHRVLEWLLSSLGPGMAVYASMVGIEHAIRHFIEARAREAQMLRLSEQLSSARFATLQSQLNPHFLFNTLNSIVVRARSGDGAATARMAEQLSEVLRRTLGRHRAHEVTLEEELALVREYLAIEQARFSDRLAPVFEIDATTLAAAVPSFALQHLVENAIRHGIARRPDAGLVRVAARRDGEMLALSVTDDGPGVGAATERNAPAGHGIDNTRARLSALHGSRATITLAGAEDRGAVATLRVPFREIGTETSVA